jgi:hypothetical protein
MLEDDATGHAERRRWGLYRNAKFEMAEALRGASQLSEALLLYLEICLMDMNGPQTYAGGVFIPEYDRIFRPFKPEYGLLAPAIVQRCRKIISDQHLSADEVRAKFFAVASEASYRAELPVATKDAWVRLLKELDGG